MNLAALLKTSGIKHYPVVDFDWENQPFHKFDLSHTNKELDAIDLNDEQAFTNYIFEKLKTSQVNMGIGGYGEKRSLYCRSNLFEGEEPRTIHLGIDIWAEAGTAIYCPLDATVHSFANRAVHGDYGPVIILRHQIGEEHINTLYGHLSTESLDGLSVGQSIAKGQQFASIGTYSENFHWPPHLHFQVIKDMQGIEGDYPGVCKESESAFYLNNCPDPAILI